MSPSDEQGKMIMTKPKIIVLCGMPCSGKSTWRSKHNRFPVASSDDYIEQEASRLGKTYEEVFSDVAPDANEYFRNRVAFLMKSKRTFVIDRTNLTPSVRSQFFSIYFDTIAVVFTTEYPNNRVGKNIPSDILINMRDSWQYPSLDEGFTKIYDSNDVVEF